MQHEEERLKEKRCSEVVREAGGKYGDVKNLHSPTRTTRKWRSARFLNGRLWTCPGGGGGEKVCRSSTDEEEDKAGARACRVKRRKREEHLG